MAVVYTLPTFFHTWPHKKINLGLDLQGGMHLVLEVQNHKAVEAELNRTVQEIKKELRDNHIKHAGISRTNKNLISAHFPPDEKMKKVQDLLGKEFKNLTISKNSSTKDSVSLVLSFSSEEIETIKKMATAQALETIRNRIDEFGVSEPDIRIQGHNRILLQLPGVTDPDRAKSLIGKTAQLTFQLVDEQDPL